MLPVSLARSVAVVSRGTFLRSLSVQLQREIPKDAPPVTGFNIIAHRMANIVLNITDKKPTNILQVYPENEMLAYCGEVNYLSMSALQNASVTWMPQNFKDADKYHSKEVFPTFSDNKNEKLKNVFDSQQFTIIIHALPVFTTTSASATTNDAVQLCSPKMLSVKELTSFLSRQGYLLLGMPDALWTQWQIEEQLQQLSDKGHLMVKMRLPLPVQELSDVDVKENDKDLQMFVSPVSTEKIRTAGMKENAPKQPQQQLPPAEDHQRRSIMYRFGVFKSL